jgi:hypothetical protein
MGAEQCTICGKPVVVTPDLYDPAQARWDCTECPAWGNLADKSTEPVEAVRERMKRLADSMGVMNHLSLTLSRPTAL